MDFFLGVISQLVIHVLYIDDGQFTHWMWVFWHSSSKFET